MKLRLSAALAALLVSLAPLPASAAPPNFVIIFIDDLGYGDIGPFGATKQRTPNLDRMAREGMKLTSFYAAPVCSVSRAQLLTGCYGARVSVPGVYPPGSRHGLHPREFTIAERLKERGYATMCIGKWHVGDQPEFLPTRQGFDHYLGIPYSNDMQRPASGTKVPVVPLVRDEKVEALLDEEAQKSLVERYTDEAVRFIREKKEQPFLLYLPHNAVHTPIHPGAKFAGKSANGRFGDWVEEVDWSVGRVLDTLRELKLDERTLVVFTSDNGPWLIKGADGGSAGPLRGGKGTTWEGGVREPTLAWWPGKIAPGSVCDAVAGTIDLLPTCVSIAGGTVPAEPVIDGRDLSPLLFGKTKESPREAHYYFASYKVQAVRQGPWKLALSAQPELKNKPVANDASKGGRLYNLDAEIGEQTDVAAQHPEIVAKLEALARKMEAEIGGNEPTARRPAGEVENPQTLYPTDAVAKGRGKDAGKSPAAATASLDAIKPGQVLAADQAPLVANKPLTISCTVETTQPDTVIVAHGGATVGYTLFIRAGRPTFGIRSGPGDAYAEITASEPLNGATKVIAKLAADLTMTLAYGRKVVATGKAQGLLGRQPAENFCVGHDDGQSVARIGKTPTFTGRITGLHLSTP